MTAGRLAGDRPATRTAIDELEEAVEESLDSGTIRALREALSPGTDAERIQYTLDLFRDVPPRVLRDDLLRLLEHPDPRVRARALALLAAIQDGVPLEPVRRLADDHPDGLVRF